MTSPDNLLQRFGPFILKNVIDLPLQFLKYDVLCNTQLFPITGHLPSSPTERAEGHTLLTISYFGLRFDHSSNINGGKLL